jgi:hypothetical protein
MYVRISPRSVKLEYHHVEKKIKKITGPWLEAIKYVLGHESNAHYEKLFADQFFDLESTAIRDMPLAAFVDVLCKNFTEYHTQHNTLNSPHNSYHQM